MSIVSTIVWLLSKQWKRLQHHDWTFASAPLTSCSWLTSATMLLYLENFSSTRECATAAPCCWGLTACIQLMTVASNVIWCMNDAVNLLCCHIIISLWVFERKSSVKFVQKSGKHIIRYKVSKICKTNKISMIFLISNYPRLNSCRSWISTSSLGGWCRRYKWYHSVNKTPFQYVRLVDQ